MRNPFRCSTTEVFSGGALLDDSRQDFQRLDEPWARTVEILIAVDDEDTLSANGAKRVPFRIAGEEMQVALRILDPKPARCDDDDVGVGLREIVPRDPCRGPSAAPQWIDSAGHRD